MDELKSMMQVMMKRFDGLETRFDGLETRFDGVETRIDGLENRIDGMDNKVDGIKQQLDRIERSQTEDVIGLLTIIDEKATKRLERHEHRIDILNERMLHVEADVRQLSAMK